MDAELILKAREQRRDLISRLASEGAVVTVKANIPGKNKNTPAALLSAAYFARLQEGLGAHSFVSLSGADGKCFVGRINDAGSFKADAVRLEEEHEIGRLIDIDVTDAASAYSLTRGGMRRCFLCGEPAFVCSRKGTHTREELVNYFDSKVSNFFRTFIGELTFAAMMSELELEDKFGLVTPTQRGSHRDLDYAIMRSAALAICPMLAECFLVGLCAEREEGLLGELRPIGIICEEKMLAATDGANAYKGFIFVGGVLLAAAGYSLGHGLRLDGVYDVARSICLDMHEGMPSDTFGHHAFRESGFGGIRKEAAHGFPTVKFAEGRLSDDVSPSSRLRTLADIVGKTDDSVLLKRAGSSERYEYYKRLISTLDTENKEALAAVNKLCLDANISIGGSADILIAAVLMKKIKNSFMTEEKRL